MKIEFCPKKEPKMFTIHDLIAGDVFRFKDRDGVYMAIRYDSMDNMMYTDLTTGYSKLISSIRTDLHNCVEILEVELKVYE